VKLVVDSQTKRNVQRLTQTYLTLSLPDIAAAVGLPSAQAAELAILRWAAPRVVAGRASAVRTCRPRQDGTMRREAPVVETRVHAPPELEERW
jgi:hypothetical protein